MWDRGARPNAPGRPANYNARAIFEASHGEVVVNGVSARRSAGIAEGNGTAASAHDSPPEPGGDVAQRLARLEVAIARLVDQVDRQSQRQTTMERHLTDLGKVLGQLGVETDTRMALVELVLDDLTAHAQPQQPALPGSEIASVSTGIVFDPDESDESAVSPVIRLRPVSDGDGSGCEDPDLTDGEYQARRSP